MSFKPFAVDNEQRAAEASYLLNHRLIQGAFADLEASIVNQLKFCPVRDREGQHELTLMLQTLHKFRSHLESHLQTGQLAKQPTLLDSMAARVNAIKKSLAQ